MSQRYIGGLIYNPPGGFSGYFDGSGDYLSLASNAAFAMGTGDFTVEGFLYLPTTQNFGTLFLSSTTGSGDSLHVQISSANKVRVTNATTEFLLGTNAIPLNTWSHIAVVRSGTTLSIYQNGVLNGSTTNSTNFIQSGALVGYEPFGGNFYFTGYISNVRVLKGTALYSGSTYTVPSGPLQAITNTSLLTCAYPTFRDGSSNNFTITVNGNTAVSTQNPFPLTQLPNPALGNQGNGVYTMSQYQSLRSQNLWPAIDPYWEYVTLMLHGNGTNGAQNNTFLDSSTNNFTITRNGNTTQGAFSPYGDNWSNYFDGNGDYLVFPSMSGFGTGDFTIEAWVYPAVAGTSKMIVDTRTPDILGPYAFSITNSDKLDFLYSGSSPFRVTSTASIAANTWTHVAVSRASGTLRLFINGVQDGSVSTSASITGNAVMWIGAGRADGSGNPGYYFNGYISNFRTLNGTGLYTTTFTPPAAPLTAITNTQVLTCQSNRFRDNSSNNFTITRNGDVSVQRFSPFHPTAPYAAGTIGGSGYFDGSGDYLTAPSNAATSLDADFTIEYWIYRPSSGNNFIFTLGDSFTATGIETYIGSSGTAFILYSNGANRISSSTLPAVGAWSHVAVVRSGTTVTLYLNGASLGTWTSSATFSGVSYIGAEFYNGSVTGTLTGYLSNLRITKGTAVYTGAFTPPTSPVTGGALLLNFTNGGIIDNAMMNDLETVGNAQISTAQSKFGGGSLAFDGTGDYLVVPSSVNTALASGDFTIEFWFYTATSQTANLFDQRSTGTQVTPVIYLNSGTIIYYVNFGARITGSSVPTGQWNHVAVCRSGTSTRMFLNGVQTGSTYTDSNNYVSAPIGLGAYPVDGSSAFNGYIDDLRITKGYARYTANFTPQRSQWQDQ